MLGKGLDVGGDDGRVVHVVGDVEEGGLAGERLEGEEHVGRASLVVPLRVDMAHVGTVRDTAVTRVTRYGAWESEGRSWCPTRVQRNEFGGRKVIGSWAS